MPADKRIGMGPALLAAGLLLALPPVVGAADHAGYVMTVRGEAFVTHSGRQSAAQVGTPVTVGSALKTGADGAMGVTLRDNTVLSFGPDTEFLLEEFLFASEDDAGGDAMRFSARLVRGSLNFLSGVIARLKPEAVTLKTPGATIGVRGTHFLVKVEP